MSERSGRHQVLVMAKEPIPGLVKTRLCPPCTPEQAAAIAAAALADTLRVVTRTPAMFRTLVLSGRLAAPAGWAVVAQRGGDLGERLAHGFADTARTGVASVLIGMDTPQITPTLLGTVCAAIADPALDAVLGPAADGGWWCLALRDPRHATVLRDIEMSRPSTGAATIEALHARGLRVGYAPVLRDVDDARDACSVAASCAPDSDFVRAVAEHVPAAVAVAGMTTVAVGP